MSYAAFEFPRSLSRLVARLPTFPPSFVLARALNLMLRKIIQRGNLQALHDKHIAIHVTDVGLRLHFTVRPNGFSAADAGDTPDLAISATMHDFYLLATRQEDPDTLFFSRRLVVEGDTELGLVAKNALDGIELPNIAALRPGYIMAQVRGRLPKSTGVH